MQKNEFQNYDIKFRHSLYFSYRYIMLLQSKTEEFLLLVNTTVNSFMESCTQHLPHSDVKEETYFIQAMCGVVASIPILFSCLCQISILEI